MGSGLQSVVDNYVQCYLFGLPCHFIPFGLEVWTPRHNAAHYCLLLIELALAGSLCMLLLLNILCCGMLLCTMYIFFIGLQALYQRLLLSCDFNLHSFAGGSSLPEIPTVSKCIRISRDQIWFSMPLVWSSNICGVTAFEAVHDAVSDGCAYFHAAWITAAIGDHFHRCFCHMLQHGWRYLSRGLH